MGHLLDALKAMFTPLRSFSRPTVTVEFPDVVRPRAERYRASFALLHEADGDEACIGCLQCERICPSKVIGIKGPTKRDSPVSGKKRSYADDFTLDLSACIFCELCVQVCPTDAIVMTREPEAPALSREALVLTMDRLYANEKLKHRSWGDGTRLMGMQTLPKAAAPAKPPAATAPTATAPTATAPTATATTATAPTAPVPPATAQAPSAPAENVPASPAPAASPATPAASVTPPPSAATVSATARVSTPVAAAAPAPEAPKP
jgi:NADH-quinone oxidoreductase subunit I